MDEGAGSLGRGHIARQNCQFGITPFHFGHRVQHHFAVAVGGVYGHHIHAHLH